MLEKQEALGGGWAVAQQEPSDVPEIEVEESAENYARVVASPLPRGFGTTVGNSLRRVLLSSLPGAAVTSVRIDGVLHEFSTIPHVKEDTIGFLLNVKELRLRALSDRPGTLVLDVSGREGEVTAADIQVPEHYEIVNPDLYLATLDSTEGRLQVEFNVELGTGYVPAGQTDGQPIGVIPVDAIFSPVRRVNYHVEHTRVGQATNYDRLVLEVWTDGTVSGVDAVSKSADILVEQLKLFSSMGRPALPVVERGLGQGKVLTPQEFGMPIEDLNLSMRAYNCLRRSGLMTVGQVLEKSEEELLALRNFGRKSYDELRARLEELALLPAEAAEDEEVMEALPLEEEESPILGRRRVEEEAAAPVPAVEEAPAAEEAAVAVEPEAKAPPAKKERKKKAKAEPEAEAAEELPLPVDVEEEALAARLSPEALRKLLKLKGEEEGKK
ncbi:MAG: DNA-directed RNA polymerase subunit alpha [Chloroflexi bacterium]|nr:DNA-directed RNA polymerase subunit alpha [Chloroflexota bacterium]